MELSINQISVLRDQFSKIKSVNPESPTLAKISNLLDKLDIKSLVKLVNAKINFISSMAAGKLVILGYRKPEEKSDWSSMKEAPKDSSRILIKSGSKEIIGRSFNDKWYGDVWIKDNGDQILDVEGFRYI